MLHLFDIAQLYSIYVQGYLHGDPAISLADVERAYQKIDAAIMQLGAEHAQQIRAWRNRLDAAYSVIMYRIATEVAS